MLKGWGGKSNNNNATPNLCLTANAREQAVSLPAMENKQCDVATQHLAFAALGNGLLC